MLGHIFPVDFIHCIYIIKKLHAHTSREFILVLIRHGSIARVITISGMQALCTVSNQIKESNHHEHDYPPICMHSGDVRWVYVELHQLRETYSVKADTFANVTVRLHV